MLEWLHKLREAGFDEKQAEAIASLPDQHLVTREYLDARLDARISLLETTLTTRMWQMAALVIVGVGVVVASSTKLFAN